MSTSLWLLAMHLPTGERRFLRVDGRPRLVGRPSVEDDGTKLIVDFDPTLSRKHLLMWEAEGRVHVKRQGSARPLFVGGVERDEFDLAPGQHFSSGQTRFEIHAQASPSAGDSPRVEAPMAMTMSPRERDEALEHDAWRCLRVLIEMQPLLATVGDTAAMFNRVMPLISQVVPSACVTMILAVDERGGLETIAAYGGMAPPTPARTLVRAALQSGEPEFYIYTSDSRMGVEAGFTHRPTVSAGVDWVLAAPIVPGEGPRYVLYTVGAAAMESTDESLPGHVDRAVLSLIAKVLRQYLEGRRAVGLQVQLHGERRQRALAESLRDLANELTSATEVGSVLERLLDALGDTLPFDGAVGFLRRSGALQASAARGVESGLPRLSVALDHPFLERFEEGRSCFVDDRSEAVLLGDVFAGMGSVLCVPIRWSGRQDEESLRGLVVLARRQAHAAGAFGEEDTHTASIFAGQASIAFKNAALFEENYRLATTDELTGASNRRNFMTRAREKVGRALSETRNVCAVMLDVDHFKKFNDRYGHSTGDEVLRHVARRCLNTLRGDAIFGRLGGEEFAILMDGDIAVASTVAERIRLAVQEPVAVEGRVLEITVSLGVASSLRSDCDLTPDMCLTRMLKCADEALYAAKQAGRNRVLEYREAMPSG